MTRALLCAVMQAEDIKAMNKYFDRAVSWSERSISCLPEEKHAKLMKQQSRVGWLHGNMAVLLALLHHCHHQTW